ncbi:TPA: phage baseplate assembly protein V [Vibrio parahaemolyticus]|nr:phage baseplate assembly protein V [Vibrio parahaemolyticus]HCH0731133.1 phage baseplate assembly protein V [Vibrio parahaemolyticus]
MSDPRIENLLKRVEELERRVAQMVVRGKVHAVDPANKAARVAYGPRGQQQLTGWLTWKPSRTGKAIVWWCPEIGEGVTVVSDGDLSLGEILPGSYQNDFPAPSEDPDEFLIHFGDGSKVSHHRGTHKLEVVNVGDVNITTQQNITVKCNGKATVNAGGDIVANGSKVKLNGGKGVVTGDCICHFTGTPHGDISSQVTAGK